MQPRGCELYKLYKPKEEGGGRSLQVLSYDKMAWKTCDLKKKAATHQAISVPSMHDHYKG